MLSVCFFKQRQKFFVAGRAEEWRFRLAAPKEAGIGREELAQFPEHSRVNGRVCDNARPAVCFRFAGFELRFHQGEDSTRTAQQCNGGGDYLSQGDEGTIGHHKVRAVERHGEAKRGEMAGVGPFHDDNARVLAEFPGKLAAANVNGINFGRAVLKEAIGETAGGSAEVNGGQAARIELEMAQTVFELESAAADVPFRDGEGEIVFRLDRVAGLFGGLAAVEDLAGQDGAPGLFAGRT
jgi:hypothetical protein